ncbi:MAG TPA: tyrosine-type recombinase/integrase [Candidatus Acidoferrales bacterium]
MEPDSQLLSPNVAGTFVKATPEKRTGRKSMSRRSGQNGCVQEDGNWYVVRFWKDVAGQQKRQRVRERICPASGAGKLSASERKRRAKEIIEASGADTVEHFEKVVRSNHGIRFREQAEIWLAQMKHRKRRPVAPSTLENWERCLRNWLNPNIGDLSLDYIGNLALRNLGATMVKGGLGASAIRSYTNAAKMVVASAINEEGDALYPRKWNHDFIDLPEDKNPKRPAVTADVVTAIVGAPTKKPYRMFYTLCSSAGLRFGEALGIDIRNISPDCTTINICQKAWRGQIHNYLKSENGKREIDLHTAVAAMLKEFIGDRDSGLLFCTRTGRQLSQQNILKRSLHPILTDLNQPMMGCHAFRRFRITWLRKKLVPEDLITFWLGHAGKTVTDTYSKLRDDAAFRKHVAEDVGLGFDLPSENAVVGLNGPKIEVGTIERVAVNY